MRILNPVTWIHMCSIEFKLVLFLYSAWHFWNSAMLGFQLVYAHRSNSISAVYQEFWNRVSRGSPQWGFRSNYNYQHRRLRRLFSIVGVECCACSWNEAWVGGFRLSGLRTDLRRCPAARRSGQGPCPASGAAAARHGRDPHRTGFRGPGPRPVRRWGRLGFAARRLRRPHGDRCRGACRASWRKSWSS